MPCGWGFVALLACWLLRLPYVGANPSLAFPVNAQVPPIARVLQPYTFVFSASTFTSTDGHISYKLSGQPSWLELAGENRTFSGMPAARDIGAATFDLVATDSSGSTTAGVTLIVLTSSDLRVGQPVLPQLAKAGPTSGPASLLLKPLQTFAFAFEAGTFINSNPDTEFYAVSVNNTPLPNWIQFDPMSLRFSGTSPPLVSSSAIPQIYGIKLVASDVPGFSEATIVFQLVVGYHILSSKDVVQSINITPGKEFTSIDFRNSLTLDSQSVSDSAITSVTSNGPEWVHLDSKTISLSGTPPPGMISINVTITVLDVYGNALNIIIDLIAESDLSPLFTGALPNANATAGEPFSYKINADLLSNDQVQLSADLRNASAWLQFSSQNRTFHGNVPKSLHTGSEMITLTATEGSFTDASMFVIHIASTEHTPSSLTSSPSPTTTSIASATLSTGSANSPAEPGRLPISKSNVIKIVLATVLPALIIAFMILLIFHWRRRRSSQIQRRHRASQQAIERPEVRITPTPELVEIPPVPRTPERSPMRSILSRPPRIEVPWAPDSLRISRNRISKRSGSKLAASVDSNWGGLDVFGIGPAFPQPSESIRPVNAAESLSRDDVPSLREVAPNYAHRKSTRSILPQRQRSVAKISSKRYSNMSMVTIGLPQRLSGFGHGAGGSPPLPFNGVRSSWQTTLGTMPGVESTQSSIVLNDFPSPPRETGAGDMGAVLRVRSPNRTPRDTVRIVREDSMRSSGVQKWYSDRARDPLERSARFSSASSRPSSSSRLLWEADVGGRTTSAVLLSDREESRRNTPQLMSRLERGGWAESGQQLRGGPSYVRTPSRLRRDVSTVSSGQFDSARSTDEWEDENLIEEENEDGYKQWRTSEIRESPSPRLPFEFAPRSPQGMMSPDVPLRRLRVADNRKAVSLADRQTRNEEKSEEGSLAFV